MQIQALSAHDIHLVSLYQFSLLGVTPIPTLHSLLHPLVHLLVRTTRALTDLTCSIITRRSRCPDVLAEFCAVTIPLGTGPHAYTGVGDEFVRDVWPGFMGWQGFVKLLGDLTEFGEVGPWDRRKVVVFVMVPDLQNQHRYLWQWLRALTL